MIPSNPIEQSFARRVNQLDECWLWTAACRNGKPVFYVEGQTPYAVRWAYSHWIAPLAEGARLLRNHACTTQSKLCVNPWHYTPTFAHDKLATLPIETLREQAAQAVVPNDLARYGFPGRTRNDLSQEELAVLADHIRKELEELEATDPVLKEEKKAPLRLGLKKGGREK